MASRMGEERPRKGPLAHLCLDTADRQESLRRRADHFVRVSAAKRAVGGPRLDTGRPASLAGRTPSLLCQLLHGRRDERSAEVLGQDRFGLPRTRAGSVLRLPDDWAGHTQRVLPSGAASATLEGKVSELATRRRTATVLHRV